MPARSLSRWPTNLIQHQRLKIVTRLKQVGQTGDAEASREALPRVTAISDEPGSCASELEPIIPPPKNLQYHKMEYVKEGSDAARLGLSASLTPVSKGMLLLYLCAALFGSNQVVIKTSEELMSPFTLNALRFSIAALCFVPVIPQALKSVPVRFALELGFWLTLAYTCQAYGLSLTSASHGAFTGAVTVLTVPILIGLSGKHVGRSVWISAATALFGISLLTGDGGAPNVGDLACTASAVLFGVHTWRLEAIVASVDDSKGLAGLQLVSLAVCSLVLAVPEMLYTINSSGAAGTWKVCKELPWGDLLFMGIGTTALTLYIEAESLKDVSSASAALIYTSEPLWGAAFAWLLLSERWGMQGWVGAALVVGASVYSQVSGDSAKLQTKPPPHVSGRRRRDAVK